MALRRTRPYPVFIRALQQPQGFLVGTFAGLIAVGTVLLCLPISQKFQTVKPVDAFFTATSAVCVTGLTSVDTEKDYSRFGQCVILGLIQLGGLGIMTFTALAMQLVGRRMSLRSQLALNDVFYQQESAKRFRQNLRWIVALTLCIELLGAGLLWFALGDEPDAVERIFAAVFHAVSAFCNAGFSTWSENLIAVHDNSLFLGVIMLLIVSGGLGYTVLFESIARVWRIVSRQEKPLLWSLNSYVVWTTSAALILLGALVLTWLNLTDSGDGWWARVWHALFQSVTARTAGYNTVDIGVLPTAALLWLILLMFIGGSPGSCAGGVKTTTLAVWVARLRARLAQREDVTIRRRRIPIELVRRTGLLVGVSALFNLVGIMLLATTEMSEDRWRLEELIFEQISAFGTVGLSTGITPHLTLVGKLWIIFTMFVGRLGPLTMALLILEHRRSNVRLPEERMMIG